MTDDALQNMAAGLALCTGMYAEYQAYTTDHLTMTMRKTASDCSLTSALSPMSLNTCAGVVSKMGDMSSACGDGSDDTNNPRTTATCASDACVAFVASVTDDALQSMSAGLASCTGVYAEYQAYTSADLEMAVRNTSSYCGLTSALSPLLLNRPLPPQPSAPPPPAPLLPVVITTVSAEGDVTDYPPSALTTMEQRVADEVDVAKEAVSITVAAGSVILTARHQDPCHNPGQTFTPQPSNLSPRAPTPTAFGSRQVAIVTPVVANEDAAVTATAFAARLERKLATAALATLVFGVTVTEPPKVTLSSLPPSAPPPVFSEELQDDSSANVETGNELTGGAIAGIVVGCLVVMAALGMGAVVFLKKKGQQPQHETHKDTSP